MNNLLRAEEDATKEMDELLADIRTCGLEVLKGDPGLVYSAMEQRPIGEPEEIDVSPVQGAADDGTCGGPISSSALAPRIPVSTLRAIVVLSI